MQGVLRLSAATIVFAHASVAGAGHLSGAVEAHGPPAVQAVSACEFQPPTPILSPDTYPGQTLERRSDNRLIEKARLNKGLRIEILQSACADFLTTEFTVIAPGDGRLQLDQNAWIELARTTITGLKTRKPPGEYSEVNDFLNRAKGRPPDGGSLAACRDGSKAGPGECSWESAGGFVFSMKRTRHETRVSITQYLSG